MGESGCGKSITSMSLMGLNHQTETTGHIQFEGQNLLSLSEKQWREVRGNDISMIFQEPMTSLNPLMTIGKQMTEALFTSDYQPKRSKSEGGRFASNGWPETSSVITQNIHMNYRAACVSV